MADSITMRIAKTIQEKQYEPLTIDISVTQSITKKTNLHEKCIELSDQLMKEAEDFLYPPEGTEDDEAASEQNEVPEVIGGEGTTQEEVVGGGVADEAIDAALKNTEDLETEEIPGIDDIDDVPF